MLVFIPRVVRQVSAGLLALFLVSLMPAALLAQSAAAGGDSRRGSVSGAVVDGSGGAVLAARVSVVDERGRVLRTTVTDGAGAFSIDALPPGTCQGPSGSNGGVP